MISCDANILFPAIDSSSPHHKSARDFLHSQAINDNFCLSEQVLMELYCLVRNPTVCSKPLAAAQAVDVIQGFRSNPQWKIIDVMAETPLMEQVWRWAAQPGCAYRRIFDMRLAATLQQHRVAEFATLNTKDFRDFGFERVWNPLQ